MSTKEAKRTNGKILKDAREYLTLVGQLGKIRIALAAETNLSHEKMEFLDSLAPIVDSSMEVVKEVGTVTQALAELPSSAPKYKRRAVGKNLTEMMLRHAVHMLSLIHI